MKSNLKTKTIKPKIDGEAPKKTATDLANSSHAKVLALSKMPDQIAESDHWVRNEPIPGGLELFPNEWEMRYSDLFYPVAKGGKLYIDTPMGAIQINRCKIKLEAYQAKGVRYTYIADGEDIADVKLRLENGLPRGQNDEEPEQSFKDAKEATA